MPPKQWSRLEEPAEISAQIEMTLVLSLAQGPFYVAPDYAEQPGRFLKIIEKTPLFNLSTWHDSGLNFYPSTGRSGVSRMS